MSHAKQLKIIARVGIGYDSVDLKYTKSREIFVTNTPDAPTESVAELTIGFVLNIAREVSFADRLIRDQKWKRITGRLISQQTLGLVGMGRIGKSVANKALALGMTVRAMIATLKLLFSMELLNVPSMKFWKMEILSVSTFRLRKRIAILLVKQKFQRWHRVPLSLTRVEEELSMRKLSTKLLKMKR